MGKPSDVTELLLELRPDSEDQAARLLPLVYTELRRLAQSYLHKEPGQPSIQATELVHEVYLKMVDQTRVTWQSRAHFFAVAAKAMRRILVDRARHRGRLKRGGDRVRVDLDSRVADLSASEDLVDLDLALDKLGVDHPDKARIVELKFFGGLTTKEVATVLDVGDRTVERHWMFARTWLYRELAGTDGLGAS